MTGDPAKDDGIDLIKMAEHQRAAGRKCIALALGTGDATIYSSLLEMAFEYEDRATRLEDQANAQKADDA